MALMSANRDMATIDNPLRLLQKMLEAHYGQYRSGEITEKEYLSLVKPIDEAIGNLEMATLQGTPVWKEVFSQYSQMPKH